MRQTHKRHPYLHTTTGEHMSMEDYNFAKAREAWATPVKIVQYNCTCGKTMKFESEHGIVAQQRTWVGLTDGEMMDAIYVDDTPMERGRRVEAKLKEKNCL
jgi:hypothetical protein